MACHTPPLKKEMPLPSLGPIHEMPLPSLGPIHGYDQGWVMAFPLVSLFF